ncbi:MAG: LamG-like jellyroll fold domain-containing protein [Pirellulaceae bacterium]
MRYRVATFIFSVLWLMFLPAAFSRAEDPLLDSVTLYASFDEQVVADFGGGGLKPRTRSDHPTEKGEYVFQDGFEASVFRIAESRGAAGGALQCVDVLPRRGRIFFPAQGNLAFDADGWGGAVSLWLNTNPNTLLKTPYCDPVQITHKGAHDGGIWLDFPDSKPRDMRLGVFPALAPDEKPLQESDPLAALVRLSRVPFKVNQWHHVVATWDRFDTGEANGIARLYVDGRQVGELKDRNLAMKWDLDQTGVYFAVNYVGLLDELALFDRALTEEEISQLYSKPGWLNEQKAELTR